jgi:uncharacterized protein YndB with AHSA1/START domain
MTKSCRSFALSICLISGTWLLSADPGFADVAASKSDAITIRVERSSKAPPEVVWAQLIRISEWWGADHTWSGDAANLTLNLTQGGGFDETLPEGGFVRHMAVIYCAPGKKLRMTGVLGPLQEFALQGTMTIDLEKVDEGCKLVMTYHLTGSYTPGLDKVASIIDKVLTEQFESLSTRAEKHP